MTTMPITKPPAAKDAVDSHRMATNTLRSGRPRTISATKPIARGKRKNQPTAGPICDLGSHESWLEAPTATAQVTRKVEAPMNGLKTKAVGRLRRLMDVASLATGAWPVTPARREALRRRLGWDYA